MRVLVTAGATEVPIDSVRAITNIFKGKTGTEIAITFALSKCASVTLLTSNPMLVAGWDDHEDAGSGDFFSPRPLRDVPYRTFDELAALMQEHLRRGYKVRRFKIRGESLSSKEEFVPYDLVIHSAAVSDYRVAGVHARGENGQLVALDTSGKVASNHERLFLELERTPKLVEQIKRDWGFTGKLVQFKLEVGITDDELIRRAQAALARSGGDLCVANCLEWTRDRAILVGRDGSAERVDRARLPDTLMQHFMP